MFGKKKSESHEVSKWYGNDCLICFAVFFFSPLVMFVIPSIILNLFTFNLLIAVPFLLLGKPLYYIDSDRGKNFGKITKTIRISVYSAVIILFILPFTIHLQLKEYYPVQRAMYLSNYTDGSTLEYLLPDKIPKNAEDYYIRLVPKILQGSAQVDIKFITDADTVARYRSKALDYGAVLVPETITDEYGEETENPKFSVWKNYLEKDGISTDDAEVYILKHGYENTPAYVLSQKAGYVRIYY